MRDQVQPLLAIADDRTVMRTLEPAANPERFTADGRRYVLAYAR
jgi:hypothetical protein